MLLIYTHKVTPRNKYIFHLIFKDILGVDIDFTTDTDDFNIFDGPKLNYSFQPLGDELFFLPKNILFETGINDQNINVFKWKNQKVFFSTGVKSALPFDPFAASFYLVSRYEEYLPHIKDLYDRYDSQESLAYQHGFIQRPMVEVWAMEIKNIIEQRYTNFVFPTREYKFLSTIDIDNAYSYRQKGLMRTLGGYVRSLVNMELGEMIERTKVLAGTAKDPYDSYDYLSFLDEKYNLRSIYFFLVADYGINDKNVPFSSKHFQALIKSIADHAGVGIHPSFASNKNSGKLKRELARLSSILYREIKNSRQHFLTIYMPDTYRNLIDLDIEADYSMGYATDIGFRASISCAHNFYDLDIEKETNLRVHPFCIMDATLKYYLKLNPDQVLEYVKPIIDEVKAVNGTLVTLWHNESFSNDKIWRGWRDVYESIIKIAIPRKL